MSANDWRQQANCLDTPVDLFFPTLGDNGTAAAAKKICAACPVRAECLNANLHETVGIWGGMSEEERRKERRRRAGFAEDAPPAQPRKRIRTAPMQPCGTRSAAIRHRLAGEPVCEPYRKASAEYQRAYRGEYRKRNKDAS